MMQSGAGIDLYEKGNHIIKNGGLSIIYWLDSGSRRIHMIDRKYFSNSLKIK